MANILHLETATTNCSVSLGRDGKLLALIEENSASYSHAEKLHVFIDSCLKEAGLGMEDLDGVAVSKGPGSYTGLRIGVSAAKGICYAREIPLISINTLRNMAGAIDSDGLIIPLLDARRMEVYAAVYDSKGEEVKPTWAEIVNEESFKDFSGDEPVQLVGNGAEKCREILNYSNFQYNTDLVPSAGSMVQLAHSKFLQSDFEDTAYFEPFYLKDFIVTKPKKI